MLGRIQVQTHHAFEFLGKPWILADLEGLYQVPIGSASASRRVFSASVCFPLKQIVAAGSC
jgi:hypothetical protein